MNRIKLGRPSPALVIACIALFVALGGVGYAAATGSIDSRELREQLGREQGPEEQLDRRQGREDLRDYRLRREDQLAHRV